MCGLVEREGSEVIMIPHEKINNNDFLCNLDVDNATNEQKIAWLCQIIKNETEKPEDEQDIDLISECSDYLYELSEAEVAVSEDKLQQGLKEIKQNLQRSKIMDVPIKRYRKKFVRTVIILAAAFIALFSGITVAAKTQGYSSAWDFVSQNIEKIIKLKPGDKMEEGNITLIKGEQSISYASIEQLIKEEKYNILYPSKLPNNVVIEKIKQQNFDNDSVILSLQTNDPNLVFSISSNSSVLEEDLQHFEIYETSNITFYIDAKPNNVYLAVGYFENYEYHIIYNDYEMLISILNNMKGI
ncbi:MAG: hypothetical protein IJX28_06390 [Clostridia bacterium]|nr:hypothetical protein [Clostridia bacterium]